MFYGCSKLKSFTIPDSITGIGHGAFSGCKSLTSITIPDSVTSIGKNAFSGCKSLTSITIPDSVTSIGKNAFSGCKRLTSITIPDSVTTIGSNAFSDCSSLTSITIPDSVTSIGDSAFSDCSNLTSITIPDSVTSIGKNAFSGCSGLADKHGFVIIRNVLYGYCGNDPDVTIPNSVTSIGDKAFEQCNKVSDLTLPGTLGAELKRILDKDCKPVIHIDDISSVSSKYRPGCAVGFAEDNRDCTDENGKAYLKYIKANAAKLIGKAIEHPALFYLMLREKLITAKNIDAITEAVQQSGNAEMIAAILDYGNSSISEKDKGKVQQKKDERDANVTNFIFDTEKLEALRGKTVVVTGKLKTFVSRDELKECLTTCGATLTETLARGVDYLITNTPNSGTAKNKKAVELGITRITEAQFNEMIGRSVQK